MTKKGKITFSILALVLLSFLGYGVGIFWPYLSSIAYNLANSVNYSSSYTVRDVNRESGRSGITLSQQFFSLAKQPQSKQCEKNDDCQEIVWKTSDGCPSSIYANSQLADDLIDNIGSYLSQGPSFPCSEEFSIKAVIGVSCIDRQCHSVSQWSDGKIKVDAL